MKIDDPSASVKSATDSQARTALSAEYLTLAAAHRGNRPANSWVETCTQAGNHEIDRRLRSGEAKLAHGTSLAQVHQEMRSKCESEYRHLPKGGQGSRNSHEQSESDEERWRRTHLNKENPKPVSPGGWPEYKDWQNAPGGWGPGNGR